MKRRLAALLALICFVTAIPAFAAEREVRTTVLIYMSGSDLERVDGSATADIQEMVRAKVPADGPLTVLVETGGSRKWQLDDYPEKRNCLYRISSDGYHLLETLGKRNMGDPDTLSEFLEYGRENYPADRYILVLWGHGDGPTGGVCFDELSHDDSLMLDEIAGVLGGAEQAGQRINAVIFDACMMNCVDLFTHLGAHTDYIVSSQESTLGTGGRYDQWLSSLVETPELSTLEICVRFAADYVSTGKHGLFSQTTTMSVLDCAVAPDILGATEALYAQLNIIFDSQQKAILSAVSGLVSFGELDGGSPSGLMDALQLCDVLEPFAPRECASLRVAVQRAVPFHADSGEQEDATCGLTLFLPCAQQRWPSALFDWYNPLAEESSYAQLIVRMAKAQRSSGASSVSSFLRDTIGGTSTESGQADMQHIWQGLNPSASADAPASTESPSTPASTEGGQADMQHIWQGLDPSASAVAPASSESPSTPASSEGGQADAQHIWQGLDPSASADAPASTESPSTPASSANAHGITDDYGQRDLSNGTSDHSDAFSSNIWQKLDPAA